MNDKRRLTNEEHASVEHMFNEFNAPLRPLTSWEEGFVSSVQDQYERDNRLTDTQLDKLKSIYEEKC